MLKVLLINSKLNLIIWLHKTFSWNLYSRFKVWSKWWIVNEPWPWKKFR